MADEVSKTAAIDEFCHATGFELKNPGEIGFGRPCVGIMDPRRECYVAHSIHDPKTYERLFWHTAPAPEGAYHKGDFLAVLIGDGCDAAEALARLERWVRWILNAGYEVREFDEGLTLASFLGAGSRGKAVVNAQIIAKAPART